MIEKIAITGAPGSGKSSILKELEYAYQERIIPEAAEDIIKYLQAKGNPEPWLLPGFQNQILKLQLQREKQAEECQGRVFIDRGILDGLAYYQLRGQTPTKEMQKAISTTPGRYQKVFLAEIGDHCQKTGVRREDLEEARILQELQYKNYTDAGYTVERLPYERIEERARRVLNSLETKMKLKELKGGERKWKQK